MIDQPTVQLFYNPGSGAFSERKLHALANAIRAQDAQVILAPSADSDPALSPKATHICISGGDGTVRHVAAMLARCSSTLPVAIYPSGTVNLLAREGAAFSSLDEFVRGLLHGQTARLHFPVTFGPSVFFACAGVGPDSAAIGRLSPGLKRIFGRSAYAIAFTRLLWSWPRPRIELSANGQSWRCEAVYIAKGRYFAGPWSFAPKASVSDGLLHVLALKTARRRDYLQFIWAMALGRDPAKLENAIGFTCRALAIYCDESMPFQADGDIVATCPVELAIHDFPLAFR